VVAVVACSSTSTAPPPAGEGSASPAPAPPAEPTAGAQPGAPPTTGTTPAPLPATWGAQHCHTGGKPGFAVGDTLGELDLVDCATGVKTTMNEVCGASATWLFVAHTHCPTCQATAGFTDDVAKAVATKDVAIAHVVYDDDGTSCAKWQAAYKLAGLTNVRVYEDPTGGAFTKLKSSNFTAPSAFLDARRVITFKEHGLSKAQVLTQIDAALAKNP